MAESLAISRSSCFVLPKGRAQARTDCCHSWIRFGASSSPAVNLISHKSIAGFGPTHLSLGIISITTARAISSDSTAPPTFIVESAGEKIDIQPDIIYGGGSGSEGGNRGGDGGGGGGGSGGGGGGGDHDNDDNNKGGGGSEESNSSKMAMSMSQKLTLGYAALVGVGGVMGYMKSGSQKSLAAGGLSTLLLYYVYTQLPTRPAFASFLGLGVSAALLGVMGSRFKKSGKLFPAGVVSLVSLVMTGGYLHGIMRSLH